MKRKIIRTGSVAFAAIAALLGGAFLSMRSATAQDTPSFDHLKCYNVRDSLRQVVYTADLVPLDDTVFTTEEGDPVSGPPPKGCRVVTPAEEFCYAVSKQNARDVKGGLPPPGPSAPGPEASEYLCYRLICPGNKVAEIFNVTDQFGARSVQLTDKPERLCAPAFRDAVPTPVPTGAPTATPTTAPTAEPTTTPTAAPTGEPTATPTAEPTGEPTATPTAEPTAEPTPTPTAGSASRAFLDMPESLL